MSDDIMKEQAEMVAQFRREFPQAITLDDTMRQMLELKADRDHWRKIADQLADGLHDALYSDEWKTREYSIVFYSIYERAVNDVPV